MSRRTQDWVLLAYRLPREPSTPRIALWRRLRRLGAVQIVDGLVALPLTAETREHLEWAAAEAVEAGGDAAVWIGTPGTAAQERALVERMRAAARADYLRVVDAAETAARRARPDGRTLAQLRRTLRAIEARDYFGASERNRARRAVESLSALGELVS